MKIGIDVSVIGAETLSGVGFHIIRLLESMVKVAPSKTSFFLFYEATDTNSEILIKERLGHLENINFSKIPFIKTKLGTMHRLKSKYWIPCLVKRNGCDVFHGPAHQLPIGIDIPSVVTMHDLAVFRHDLYEPSFNTALKSVMKSSVERATSVIALSEYTKQEIQSLTDRKDGIEVIYGAGNYANEETRKKLESDKVVLENLNIKSNYIFYVGDFGVRKNIPYLIEAFAAFKKLEGTNNTQLVLAGNSAPVRKDLDHKILSVGLDSNDVVFPGRVSDEELKVLYRNAGTFALASLGEGFTLVTLEAMSYGVPVVATNTTSIKEGTGEAAKLVELDDPIGFAEELKKAMFSEEREKMIDLGLERVKLFTWELNARKTLELYENVMK